MQTFITPLLSLYLFLFFCSSLDGMQSPPPPLSHPLPSEEGLLKLEEALAVDLELINYPPLEWRVEHPIQLDEEVLDVAIIGAGMSGLTIGAALYKEGIRAIQIFDQSIAGKEGPWMTHARMKTLKSDKAEMALALGIPRLTFRAWFEAQFGFDEWERLVRIPNYLWMDYLKWYRHVMELPVENECRLLSLKPKEDYFLLEFCQKETYFEVKALKVVLATGRGGFGGASIPFEVKHLPRKLSAHVTETIDFASLEGKKVAVIGAGASAFDAAAVALESGAQKVDLLMRQSRLPSVHKLAGLPDKCLRLGFCSMTDQWRWSIMAQALSMTPPPPLDALKRVYHHPNFHLLSSTSLCGASYSEDKVILETNRGEKEYDFLILGTGYAVDGRQQPELSSVIDEIKLWSDVLSEDEVNLYPKFGYFPYLGPSFEFLEKIPGRAPYLKNLYCFNYGAIMSHGLLTSDISSISFGATRLAESIAIDFLIETSESYLSLFEAYDEEDFEQEDYFPSPLL